VYINLAWFFVSLCVVTVVQPSCVFMCYLCNYYRTTCRCCIL